MVGWHHRLNGPEFEQTSVDDGQGSKAYQVFFLFVFLFAYKVL